MALRIQSESEIAVKLEIVGFLETRPGWNGNRHAHAFWELVFMEQGRGRLSYREQSFPIRPGTVFLFPPHVPHRFDLDADAGSRHLYIGFAVTGGFPSLLQAHASPLLDPQDTPETAAELREIAARVAARKEPARLERQKGELLAVLLRLLSRLLQDADPAPETPARRAALLAEKAKAHLAANPGRRISVHELAASFYLSPHYFGDLFKTQTGMTVKAYHNQVRLKAAAERLRHPDLQVSQIADELGFASIHYFSRKFRCHFGLSPTEFRARPPAGPPRNRFLCKRISREDKDRPPMKV